ncbi:hypothetical protein [Synechococcus sp. CS-1327]|uniref:hypothetical protein n=1 Tax=Synechococcus sp. CS-1327 TaxID=2847977 RepID=UPI00223AB6C3|nr:hypothetical protein [Synechococcus sp. CS-1327]MCT0232996.1 hypothetical protein [Synechococcus sp. CS-1327]
MRIEPSALFDSSELSSTELLLVVGLIAAFAIEIARAYGSNSWLQLYRPTVFLAAILSYYCLLSPLRALALGEWVERGQNLRGAMVYGWGGALAFYLSVLVGFHEFPTPRFDRRFILEPDPERLYRLGRNFCLIGLGLYALSAGTAFLAQLNPLTVRDALVESGPGLELGAFASYVSYGVNLLIPGVLLQFTSWVISRRHLVQLLGWGLATTGLFTTLGFRWRLVILVLPMLLLWYLVRGRRPQIRVLVAFGAAAILVVAGALGIGRDYGRGIDVEAVQGSSLEELIESGFVEGRSVFFTTGGVIMRVPDRALFVGLAPFISVLQIPIPRAFLPDKDTIGYLSRSIQPVFGDPAFSVGAAVMNFGEYYLVAGWPSLVAISMLMGWLLRWLWNWFLLRCREPFAQVIYLLSACFLYVIVSRGYLAQITYLSAFTLLPLFWMYGRWAQPPPEPKRAPRPKKTSLPTPTPR